MTNLINLPVSLTLARVNFGGNAGRGRYFFDFSTDSILVQEAKTLLTITLSPDTPQEIIIESLVSSDARGQLGTPTITNFSRSVEVVVDNSLPYIIQVGLILRDEKTGELIVCDPQVICRPPPHATGGGG
ncbi:hypothetical protein [Tahibacter harae]|uniref:Curli assembly protein CsgC n=1 Tax=Tahibacter harae TaxID=2963937 RepID=A0ABT1QW46_9GAMM|nr:hypothetical protein [Tahibacter harae]MCQ4166515.1 hypothetical protein [Tahibacter harae]